MKEIKRVSAGVMFESDVLDFINQLAFAQQRHRSFIVNSIIRYYARLIHPLGTERESAVSLPVIPQPLETPPFIRF